MPRKHFFSRKTTKSADPALHVDPAASPANVDLPPAPDDRGIGTCTGCAKPKAMCPCEACAYCGYAFRLRLQRHHCRRCWKPICADCRSPHEQWIGLPSQPRGYLCHRCAVPRALCAILRAAGVPSLSVWSSNSAKRQHGLVLLADSMRMPNQCVDSEGCAQLSYGGTCPACWLPTVPFAQFAGRSVASPEDDSTFRQLMKLEARISRNMMSRSRPTYGDMQQLLAGARPPAGISRAQFEDVVLCCLASSFCYEYNGFLRITMAMSDCPAVALLRPIEVNQAFTVFDAPGDVIIVAFPGTHDLRTAISDIKFHRVVIEETVTVCAGVSASAHTKPSITHGGIVRLHRYRVHHGFNEAAAQVEHWLSSAAVESHLRRGKRVIFTGHSLGGAIAILTTLRHLRDIPEFAYATHGDTATGAERASSIQCVTFGAPQVGDAALGRRVRSAGWEGQFLNVVHRGDIVPRLLTARTTERAAVRGVAESVRALPGAVVTAVTEKGSRVMSWVRNKTSAVIDKVATITTGSPAAPVDASNEPVGANEEESDNEDEAAAAPTGSADGGVVPATAYQKRAFDTFGRYLFLREQARPVTDSAEQAASPHLGGGFFRCSSRVVDSAAAFDLLNSMPDGAMSTSVADHLLDAYLRAVTFASCS